MPWSLLGKSTFPLAMAFECVGSDVYSHWGNSQLQRSGPTECPATAEGTVRVARDLGFSLGSATSHGVATSSLVFKDLTYKMAGQA